MSIQVNSVELRQCAGKVDGIASNFQSEIENLGRVVTETGSYMQGGPQASFEQKYEEFKSVMNNFIGALNNYSAAMKAYANDSDEYAKKGTQRFDSI